MYHKHFGYDNPGAEQGPEFFKHMGHRCGGGFWGRRMGQEFRRAFGQVPVNIRETDSAFELHVYAPGLQKSDFQVSVEGQELIIGYRAPENGAGDRGQWLRAEHRNISFERRFQLTERIDAENISAAYTDGVLIVTLPKLPGFSAPKQDIAVA